MTSTALMVHLSMLLAERMEQRDICATCWGDLWDTRCKPHSPSVWRLIGAWSFGWLNPHWSF